MAKLRATSDQALSDASAAKRDRCDRNALHAGLDAAILIVDASGTILASSPPARALLGFSENGPAALPDVIPALSPAAIESLCSDPAGWTGSPLDAKTASGALIPVLASISPIELDRQSCFVVVIRDARRVEAALARVVRAERLAAADDVLSALAHEHRNVLQHMQSCVTLIDLRGNDEVKRFAAELQQGQDRLRQLFEEVRELVAPVRLERRRADVRMLVERAWRQLRLRWSKNAVDLQLDAEACREPRAYVDPRVLGQALRAVLDAAIDCSAENATVRCAFTGTADGGLTIAIQSAGGELAEALAGDSLDSLRTIFAKGSRKGLLLAQRLFREHAGELHVERTEAGSRFVIELPAVDVES